MRLRLVPGATSARFRFFRAAYPTQRGGNPLYYSDARPHIAGAIVSDVFLGVFSPRVQGAEEAQDSWRLKAS
jgi:hypothetical protein